MELVRGGASDLYGSSAIGGVIDVMPVVPQTRGLAFDLAGATEDTISLNGLATEAVRGWSGLAAVTVFDTERLHSHGSGVSGSRWIRRMGCMRRVGGWSFDARLGDGWVGVSAGQSAERGAGEWDAASRRMGRGSGGTRRVLTGRRVRWGGSLCGRTGLDQRYRQSFSSDRAGTGRRRA